METLKYLKCMHDLFMHPNTESLNLSLADTHHKGLFSLVIEGTEFGKLTRVFIAEKSIKPFAVQLHTHRYPIKLTAIKGNIKQYVAFPSGIKDAHTVEMSEFEYKSPLNGGGGLKYLKESVFIVKDFSLPIGSNIEMTEDEYHTISCSKGSIWIVEELGFKKDSSRVLGVPFITKGLYNEPQMFQVNDKCQMVAKELQRIILDYERVNPLLRSKISITKE